MSITLLQNYTLFMPLALFKSPSPPLHTDLLNLQIAAGHLCILRAYFITGPYINSLLLEQKVTPILVT